MKYLILTLMALFLTRIATASNVPDIISTQKQLGDLVMEISLDIRDEINPVPHLVCKLTNISAKDFMHGHGTPALGFIFSAEGTDGKPAKYSPHARELFRPRAYIHYVHRPIKPGESIEYVVPVKDIQGFFAAPIKTLHIEWSRGFDPTGSDYPTLSGAIVDLDINLIIQTALRLAETGEAPTPPTVISETTSESTVSQAFEPAREPLKSFRTAPTSLAESAPPPAKTTNNIWWFIGALTMLIVLVLILCRKKGI